MSTMFEDMPDGINKHLSVKKVFIAGAGGLGSNVAMLLIRAGIKRFKIIDFDRVELKNLNRQFYFQNQIGQAKVDALKTNLLSIQPEAQIEIFCQKMTEDNMSEMISDDTDILLECFDNPLCKAELVQYMLLHKKNVPIIAVSGIAGIDSLELIKCKKGPGNLYIIGDGVNGIENGLGTLSTRVMCAAAHQAHTAINLLVNC